MGDFIWVIIVFVVAVPAFVALISTIVTYNSQPFKYPYKAIYFDVTGTKQPKIAVYLDKYLIENGLKQIESHMVHVLEWKDSCNQRIKTSLFKKKRQRQFDECLDTENTFKFILFRNKTRYRQANYVKHPYTVRETYLECSFSYAYLKARFLKLSDINFEATLYEYHSKSQRSLMTKELREQIALRDNYTCQICGKYMPDGVGLHIDHIVPISKGGKSIPSNLQVLCSKCNGKKSAKELALFDRK